MWHFIKLSLLKQVILIHKKVGMPGQIGRLPKSPTHPVGGHSQFEDQEYLNCALGHLTTNHEQPPRITMKVHVCKPRSKS